MKYISIQDSNAFHKMHLTQHTSINTNHPYRKRTHDSYSENSLKFARHAQLYLNLWFVLSIQMLAELGKKKKKKDSKSAI